MKPNQRYSLASVIFLVLSTLVISYGKYYFLGIQTIDLFLALVAMAYISSFMALMNNRKSVWSWILIIFNSIIVICVIYFLTHYKMKL